MWPTGFDNGCTRSDGVSKQKNDRMCRAVGTKVIRRRTSVATGPGSEHNLRQTSGEDDEVLLVRHDTAVEVPGVRTQRVVKAATACL